MSQRLYLRAGSPSVIDLECTDIPHIIIIIMIIHLLH